MYYAFEQRYSVRTENLITEVEVFPDPIKDKSRCAKIRAKWDTGANHTVISMSLMEKLRLVPIDSEILSGLGGSQTVDVVRLAVKLPNDLFVSSRHIGVCHLQSLQNFDMLIGMDIIQLGDFHISNAGGKTSLSFVIPPLPAPFSLAAEAGRLNGFE
ncbi:MAG: retropepsin-like domain-containing protein [Spirochaetaceae bacterium]|jgi:hypothetical protein|nr:retropepsin-like domain-containing protein [Spirochaetaceae bacterium]